MTSLQKYTPVKQEHIHNLGLKNNPFWSQTMENHLCLLYKLC